MAYNYNNNYQGYYGMYGNNYMPNTAQNQNFQYQQPMSYNQNYMNNNNLDGFPSYFVDTYEQVRQANVASDGTPSIFISNTEDIFWLKKTNTENGRTIVKTFVFKEDTEENKLNSTITEQNEEAQAINREELNTILAPLIKEIETIKDAIFNSASVKTTDKKINIPQ